MQAQSTAPLSRGARRAYTMLATVSVLLLGAGIGVMAYGALAEPAVIAPFRGILETPVSRLASRLMPRDPKAIATIGRFTAPRVLWIDDTGLWAYNRAVGNRDYERTVGAMQHWETFVVQPYDTAFITNRTTVAFQVEILGGPWDGRRGWTDLSADFVPED